MIEEIPREVQVEGVREILSEPLRFPQASNKAGKLGIYVKTVIPDGL